MKYYAVADDPRELMHYGVKGMKWGKHLFGDKPRSPGFKKAASKLRASMKSGIQKKQATWKEKSAAKQDRMMEKAERRLNYALEKQAANSVRQQQRAVRREMNREASAERRENRQMQKYMQKARHGTLKYKKLRDDQIETIANRLNLENQARRLSGNETPHMLTRIKRSVGEGIVSGVGTAVAVGITEHARAKARYNAEKKYGEKTARREARAQHIKDRQKRKDDIKAKRDSAYEEARLAVDKEYYKELAENGDKRRFLDVFGTSYAVSRNHRAKELQKHKEYNQRVADTKKLLEDKAAEAKKRQEEWQKAELERQRAFAEDARRAREEEAAMRRRMAEYAYKKGIDQYYKKQGSKQPSTNGYRLSGITGKRKRS